MERVQSVLPQKPGRFLSFCGQLLRKDQKELPVPVKGSLWLSSIPRALASGLPRVWPNCNAKWGDSDPIFLGKPETFYPGIVRYLRPGTAFLGKSH